MRYGNTAKVESVTAAVRRRAGRTRRVPVVVLVSVAALCSVSAVSAGAAGAATTGPGSITVTPTAVAGSATVNASLRYTAPSGGLSAGVVKIAVPLGWSHPQIRHPARRGYATTSKGVISIARRSVVISSLTLCGGCSITVRVTNSRTPRVKRVSKFVTRSARSAGAALKPLAVQPTVSVVPLVVPPVFTPGGSVSGLGDYAGGNNPLGIARFGSATGAPLTLATDYLNGSNGWSGMESVGGIGAWRSSRYRLVLGVPIIPNGTGGTLAGGAAGSYNSHFVTLARNLVGGGEGDAILRLGWEFNANWYNWGVYNANDATNYAAFFRNIVKAMRSVPGQAFQFVWNSNGQGPTSYSPSQAYPGSAYVDYIGSDVYGNCWCSPFTPQSGWAMQVSQPWGLDWLASFAAQVGRPIVFPEWSVDYRPDGHGLGDDPYFVNQLAAWMGSHNVAWSAIFSYNAPDQQNDITDGNFPQSLAAFKADFG